MTSTRRTFLTRGTTMAATAAVAMAPRPLLAHLGGRAEPIPPIEDPRIRQLAHVGLDAARAAGASYADVRLTYVRQRVFVSSEIDTYWKSADRELMTVGVRALVNGYWGFVSGPVWSPEEMVRLGRAATNLGRTNALGKVRSVNLAPVSVIKDGHWTMPVGIDPFTVPREEISDLLGSLYRYGKRLPDLGVRGFDNHFFFLVEKAFGSTDGSYCTQRLFRSGMDGGWRYKKQYTGYSGDLYEYLSPAGRGWEMYRDQPLRDYLRSLYEELKEDAALPVKPIDVGRYDAVLDAQMVTGLLGGSIGAATQLDRALGYEANAGGTSYLSDPQTMLGSFKIGAPLLTVTANRNVAGAAATVRWDDEGVQPEAFTLIQNGMLADFQTTRESAGWMHAWNNRTPFRSHGCAAAPEAVDVPMAHTPNLSMTPASETADTASLVAGMEKGVLIKRGGVSMDFQQLNGYGGGYTYEVKQGKRVAMLAGAGVLLRAPEFWRSLLAIGSQQSIKRYANISRKGEPSQQEWSSIDAVPVAVKDLTIIDRLRKA